MKTAIGFLLVVSCTASAVQDDDPTDHRCKEKRDFNASAADAAQDKDPTTLRGTIQFQPIEGGFWTLKFKGKTYDLHGLKDKKGFAAGDEVVVTGKVVTDQCCIHAAGPIFQVATIKKVTPK